MKRPVTYAEAAAMPIPDVFMRWQELERRDQVAGCDGEDAPPLTVNEYLELLALAEVLARFFRQATRVRRAFTAGASWEQVRNAVGVEDGLPDVAVAMPREANF